MRYLILLAILLVPLSSHAYCLDDDYECWERVNASTLARSQQPVLEVVETPTHVSQLCERGYCSTFAEWTLADGINATFIFVTCMVGGACSCEITTTHGADPETTTSC